MTNPPDTSVTERVARAIYDHLAGSNPNEQQWTEEREAYCGMARAAISSMPALEEENESWLPTTLYCLDQMVENNPTRESLLNDIRNLRIALTSTREGLSTEQEGR